MTEPSLSFTLLFGVIGTVIAITPHVGWEGVVFRAVGLSLLLLGIWIDGKIYEKQRR